VADQLGHGLGVNLDVYTVAALDQRRRAVQVLETTLIRDPSASFPQEQIGLPSSKLAVVDDTRHVASEN